MHRTALHSACSLYPVATHRLWVSCISCDSRLTLPLFWKLCGRISRLLWVCRSIPRRFTFSPVIVQTCIKTPSKHPARHYWQLINSSLLTSLQLFLGYPNPPPTFLPQRCYSHSNLLPSLLALLSLPSPRSALLPLPRLPHCQQSLLSRRTIPGPTRGVLFMSSRRPNIPLPLWPTSSVSSHPKRTRSFISDLPILFFRLRYQG